MIDVLAFPPDPLALEALRVKELGRSRRLEQQRSVALFVGVGLALAWAADVGAAFGTRGAAHPFAFALASFALALSIFTAHFVANQLSARAAAVKRTTARRFGDVRCGDAKLLLAAAATDRVLAQYLRMVGRQQRALRVIELESLMAWTRTNEKARSVSDHEGFLLAAAA